MTDNTWIWIVAVALFIIFAFYSKIKSFEQQVKALKFKVNQLTEQVDLPEHPVDQKVRELLVQGKEVEAIKEVRLALGLSLLEAKQYVDGLKEE